MESQIAIERVTGGAALDDVRALFLEYRDVVGGSICFQTFDAELAALPGDYAPPTGRLLLARCDGVTAGCVALRSLAAHDGEMKRLYVRPAMRGHALGRRLVERVIDESRTLGHRRLLLDTLPSMHTAQALYRALGFREITPYHGAGVTGTKYFEREL